MRAKEFVEEARSHPDLNRKFDSGRHELYRWVADHNIGPRAMWGLSMTMLPKLGINPQKGASDDTPKGIYFYPLWYIWPWVNGGEELPWGNDFPYIQLFQYDNSRQMTQQSKVDPAQLKQALRQYCPEEIIENTEYNNDPYWFIYDCLVQLGQSDETTIVRWNKVLRDLGFTSVMDEGKGWIATNEPVQGIILDPRIIKQVKTFENYNRKQPINESIDADKVLQYVKRVHAPDEFNIEYSITDHPKWELKSIPLSKLKLDPEGEQRDPYRRVNWVDYDKVQDLIPKITSVLKSSPIVVDPQGWIIDGNHRATAAAEAGLKSVPAYVPAEVNENFADGKVKGKSRPGRVKKAGASCKGSVSSLRAKAKKYGGERGKMYHWCANMKSGRSKK